VIDFFVRKGRAGIDFSETVGRSGIFLLRAIFGLSLTPKGLKLLIRQMYAIGVLSLVIIIVSGLFIGMVLGLQGYSILEGNRAAGV